MTQRLTELTSAGGCARKLPRHLLAAILPSDLASRPWTDAAISRVGTVEIASSVDFGTPVLDDPSQWGAVAAAHAMSDLYAVGAQPTIALAVMAWPRSASLTAAATALEAAASLFATVRAELVGGHTIASGEPLLGFAVFGLVPESPLSSSAAKPGDQLILTKPIGTGLLLTASRLGIATLTNEMIKQMICTNEAASRAALVAGLEAATDVSGYGLLGAAYAIAEASAVTVTIDFDTVPLVSGARNAAASGAITPLAEDTLLLWAQPSGIELAGVNIESRFILSAPETSGGLLLAASADRVNEVLSACEGSVIGIVEPGPARVRVT